METAEAMLVTTLATAGLQSPRTVSMKPNLSLLSLSVFDNGAQLIVRISGTGNLFLGSPQQPATSCHHHLVRRSLCVCTGDLFH